MMACLDMTPPSALAAPDLDSVAFTETLAAYQRSRRLLESVQAKRTASASLPDVFRPDDIRSDASLEVIHEMRIARARLRGLIVEMVAAAVCDELPKATIVRRVNDRVNALVRTGEIDPDAMLVSEIIEWIVDGYPDDVTVTNAARGRPTPARRDVIPLQFARTQRVG